MIASYTSSLAQQLLVLKLIKNLESPTFSADYCPQSLPRLCPKKKESKTARERESEREERASKWRSGKINSPVCLQHLNVSGVGEMCCSDGALVSQGSRDRPRLLSFPWGTCWRQDGVTIVPSRAFTSALQAALHSLGSSPLASNERAAMCLLWTVHTHLISCPTRLHTYFFPVPSSLTLPSSLFPFCFFLPRNEN